MLKQNTEKEKLISLPQLKNILYYNPHTGIFAWLINGHKKSVGQPAGYISKGYMRINIDKKYFLVHRLAFFYMTGKWPIDQVDHINGNRSDNRWANLRESNDTLNRENIRKRQTNNTSGYLGVSFKRAYTEGARPWAAQIQVSGKHKVIGYFATPEEAHEEYLKEKRKLHKGCSL